MFMEGAFHTQLAEIREHTAAWKQSGINPEEDYCEVCGRTRQHVERKAAPQYRLQRFDVEQDVWMNEEETGSQLAMVLVLIAHVTTFAETGWRLQPCQ
jgi:hypothetical protein